MRIRALAAKISLFNVFRNIRLDTLSAFKKSRYFPELPSDFIDHLECCLAHRCHSQSAYKEWKYASHQKTYHNIRVCYHYLKRLACLCTYCLAVCGEKRKRCQGSGADCKAFADGCGCIAQRIK